MIDYDKLSIFVIFFLTSFQMFDEAVDFDWIEAT